MSRGRPFIPLLALGAVVLMSATSLELAGGNALRWVLVTILLSTAAASRWLSPECWDSSALPPVEERGGKLWPILTVATLAAAVRLVGLGEAMPHVNLDEGMNADIILSILDGDYPPPFLTRYVHGEPSAVYYLMALACGVLGPSVAVMRLPAALAGALGPVLLYLIGRRFMARGPALVAALLMACDPWAIYFSREINSISFAPTATLLAAYGLLAALERPCSAWRWGLAGLALGLGLHTYPPYLVIPGLAGMSWLAIPALRARLLAAPGAFYWGGALVSASPILVWSLVHPAFWRRPLRMLVASEGAGPGWELLRGNATTAWQTLTGAIPLAGPIPLLPGIASPLFFLGVAGLFLGRTISIRGVVRGTVALLVLLAPALIVKSEAHFPRRFLLALPLLQGLAGFGVAVLGRMLEGRLPWRTAGTTAVLATFVATGFFSGPLFRTVEKMRPDIWTRQVSRIRMAAALQSEGPVVIPRSLLTVPFLSEHPVASPNVVSLQRIHALPAAPGLCYGPWLDPERPTFVVVDGPDQVPWMKSLYSGAEPLWKEPEGARSEGFPVAFRMGPEIARGYRGITFEGVLSDGTPRGPLVLPSFGSPFPEGRDAEGQGWLSARWQGALHIPVGASWKVSVRGEDLTSLRVGVLRGEGASTGGRLISVSGWLEEGYHSFAVESENPRALRGEPPRLLWRREGDREPREVPDRHIAPRLPADPLLQARPALPGEIYRLESGPCIFMREVQPPGILQGVRERGDQVYLLTGQPGRVVERRDRSLVPDPAWPGLASAYHEGRWLGTRLLGSAPSGGIALGPAGGLILADAPTKSLERFDAHGRALGPMGNEGSLEQPLCVERDPESGRTYVSDVVDDFIHVFDARGESLFSWSAPRATALAVRPGGAGVVAAHPGLGALIVYSVAGEIEAVWRASEVTPFSRIVFDSRGRLLHLMPESNRIGVYSGDGVLQGAPLDIPRPSKETLRVDDLAQVDITVTGDGQILLGLCLPENGVRYLRLVPAETPISPVPCLCMDWKDRQRRSPPR